LGLSPDAVPAQKKFHEKFNLPFDLLCDTDKKVAQAYGVWKEKNMYGKIVMGIERSTFIIGPDGKVVKEFRKVKADGHVEQVLEALGSA
jgi:peroxiredoxin Q/BCP